MRGLEPLAAPRLATGALFLALMAAACSAPAALTTAPPSGATQASPSGTTEASPDISSPDASSPYGLGAFPAFPFGPLPTSTVTALQAVLDDVIREGGSFMFAGVTAAVIVADEGSWTGAAGTWDDIPLTTESRHPTHSAAKTVVAAQILRLVEEGKLGLDDLASDHLPPELAFFDANGATIRQVLAMRSGIPTLNGDLNYLAELASSVEEVFRMLPEPAASPDTRTSYAGPNYLLLGAIIEHTTGRPLAEAIRSSVLANPALEGLVYTAGDAMASDGWGVETTSASLARWGYELYGGSVLSVESLRAMTDFRGQWYGLGIMDFSKEYGGELAIGHQGLSSTLGCCSAVVFQALPAEGIVISVQADTSNESAYVDTNTQVDRLARALRDALRE